MNSKSDDLQLPFAFMSLLRFQNLPDLYDDFEEPYGIRGL